VLVPVTAAFGFLVFVAGSGMSRKPDAIGIITVIFILGTLFTAAVQAMGAG